MKYEVITYQSGTTWINTIDNSCKLHIGYWKKGNAEIELCIHDRGLMEKQRFANVLCQMLNDINKPSPKPFMCSMYAGKMKIHDTYIKFWDAYMGEMVVECYDIKDTRWIDKVIPDDVRDDLKNGFEKTLEHSKRK